MTKAIVGSDQCVYVWVEGDDDERLIFPVVSSRIAADDGHVFVQKYASMAPRKVKAFIASTLQAGSRVIFTGDLDSWPDSDNREAQLRAKYGVPPAVPVIVVCKMIESWYLAGIPPGPLRRYSTLGIVDVCQVDKARFDSGRPTRFRTRVEWLIELVNVHDANSALRRCPSYSAFTALF